MTTSTHRAFEPLPPGSTIGILGGGQLGRMLAVAAAQLGFKSHIYCARPGPNPAFDVAGAHTVAAFSDTQALADFATQVDCVTFEFENIPAQALATLAHHVPTAPPRKALEIAQDRLAEKRFLAQLGLPVAPFAPVDDRDSLRAALQQLKSPALLKTRRLGYDGKGQVRISPGDDLDAALQALSPGDAPLSAIVEKIEPFTGEFSVLLVRGRDGACVCYDICENHHEGGILRQTRIPAGLPQTQQARARQMAKKIAEALDYVGVLAVELFYTESDATAPLKINEIAPRVHNSGHWTLDACATSQFANHIRAVAGWPLAPTGRHSDCALHNLIGHEVDDWLQIASDPRAVLHLYGKTTARKGRKMGHVTRLSPPDRPHRS